MGGGRLTGAKLTLLAGLLFFGLLRFDFGVGQAATLTNRSIQIGSATPSGSTNYLFQFFVPSTTTLGSIVFQFCSNTPLFTDPCVAPNGLDVSGATLTSQIGNAGFSVNNSLT